MDFPLSDFDQFLEENLLGPLLFPRSTPRTLPHSTLVPLVPRLQIHPTRSLLSAQASMPDPSFFLGRPSTDNHHHPHSRMPPLRNNRAATQFNSSRAASGPSLPPAPNNRSTAPPERSRLLSSRTHDPSPRPPVRLPPSLQTRNRTLQPHSNARATPVRQARPDPPFREPNSDDFLNELANRDFSSPSLPPQQPRSPPDSSPFSLGSYPLSAQAREGPAWGTTSPPNIRATGRGDISPKREHSVTSTSPCTQASGHDKMPASRRGRGAAHSDPDVEGTDVRPTQVRSGRSTHRPSSENQPSRKRKLGEVAQARVAEQKATSLDSDDSPFADSKEKTVEVIDLADTEDVPDLGSLAAKKHQVQLKGFQCVICMDDTTNLTVTHCGHLFCGECLHSSLQIDSNKKICPICRQKIDLRPAAPGASANTRAKAKTFYPLRMKLMTAKRRGKQAARQGAR